MNTALARQIVDLHKQLALVPNKINTVSYKNHSELFLTIQAACRQLGFIGIDADCIAHAWEAQTRRTGLFDASAWPCNPADFAVAPRTGAIARANSFAPCPQNLGLYAVLPDAAWVERMARAGVPTLQLRFKSPDRAAVRNEVHAAVAAVQGTPSLLFINDHWQDAVDAGAYGVHLGQEDLAALPASSLAAIRQAGLRLGLSSHGYAEMLRADAVSPSYIAMGAVYATTLKQMQTPPQGPARLAAYARLLGHASLAYPLVAIGGIDESRFDEVCAPGIGSVAVVRALVAAADPEAAAQRMMRNLAL